MKIFIRIFWSLCILGVVFIFGAVAYSEPDTWIGYIYAKSKYDPEDKNLGGVSDHLKKVEGGYLEDRLDSYIFDKLSKAKPDSNEYKNILGFYANQAYGSRAGVRIFKEGEPYLKDLIRYGRLAEDSLTKQKYLFLAYGVATQHECYKPIFEPDFSIDQNFDFIESGDFDKVGIFHL